MNEDFYRLDKKLREDFERTQREVRESSAELNKEFKERLEQFDTSLRNARTLSRDVIYKIILLCTSIIGFSLALISTNGLSVSVDVDRLRLSWYIFLNAIIFGFVSLFIEGRVHYALGWRAFQVQEFDSNYVYGWSDKLRVLLVALYSLVFPRNLFFCRSWKTEEDKIRNGILNAKTVQLLAEWEKLTFLTENIFIISFLCALYIFITSYR